MQRTNVHRIVLLVKTDWLFVMPSRQWGSLGKFQVLIHHFFSRA